VKARRPADVFFLQTKKIDKEAGIDIIVYYQTSDN